MSLTVGILLLDGRLLPHLQLFILNYSLPTAMEGRAWAHTHTDTHTDAFTQLFKCMCHVLAVIFLGLCFRKGTWQLQCGECAIHK